MLSGCAVQPVFLFERAGRWVIHWGPRHQLPRSKQRDADIQAIIAWAMAYEEALVRTIPSQWVWWHKRWRTREEDRDPQALAEKAARSEEKKRRQELQRQAR